jgi:hypothetical protein
MFRKVVPFNILSCNNLKLLNRETCPLMSTILPLIGWWVLWSPWYLSVQPVRTVQHFHFLSSFSLTDLSWESGQSLILFIQGCFILPLLWPWHRLCLIYLLKRHVFSHCPLLCLTLIVCWLLLGGPVHSKNPISIVAGLIIVQIPILLSIQRSWLNFVPVSFCCCFLYCECSFVLGAWFWSLLPCNV